MILTPHILVGAAIASKTANPVLGIFFAFLSHYIIDAIPHTDYSIESLSEQKRDQTALKEFLCALTDVAFGLALVYFLTLGGKDASLLLAAGFAAALPDAIGVLGNYFVPRPLLNIVNAGHKLHAKNKKPPLLLGAGAQLSISIVAVVLILT